MKNTFFCLFTGTLLFLLLTACAAAPAASAMQPLATQSRVTDASVTPTATPDYQATISAADANAYQAQQDSLAAQQDAINAQETSQAALVAIVAFTQAAEQVQLEYVRATQQSEAQRIGMTQQVEGWTATAALTNIPATQTQQAINNTQIPAQQIIMNTAQAMTIAAPTVAAAIQNEAERAKYCWVNYVVVGIVSLTATALMIWAIVFINHNLRREQAQTEQPGEPFIIPMDEPIQVAVHTTTPNQTGEYLTVPATAEMLTEFADGIINQGKQMALRFWEGGQTMHWTRELYYPMRHFMQTHKYAASAGGKDGRLVLLVEGESFLRGWLTSQSLPHRHKLNPNIVPPAAETPLNQEALSRETPVGEQGGA